MLTLYHGPTSVCSQKVRLALAEIGLPYDGVLLDLQKGDQFTPAYMALNPEAVVPTLVDGELVVVESSLIAEYLDKTHNSGRLMPQDIALEMRVRHWLLRCLSVHGAINSLSFATFMRDRVLATMTAEEIEAVLARIPDPANREKRRDLYTRGLESHHVAQALGILRRTFADMCAHLDGGAWVSGPAFGLADIGLLPYIDRLERLGLGALWDKDFQRIGPWLGAMRARPSYGEAVESFIPASVAHSQRLAGARHWNDLARMWSARP